MRLRRFTASTKLAKGVALEKSKAHKIQLALLKAAPATRRSGQKVDVSLTCASLLIDRQMWGMGVVSHADGPNHCHGIWIISWNLNEVDRDEACLEVVFHLVRRSSSLHITKRRIPNYLIPMVACWFGLVLRDRVWSLCSFFVSRPSLENLWTSKFGLSRHMSWIGSKHHKTISTYCCRERALRVW